MANVIKEIWPPWNPYGSSELRGTEATIGAITETLIAVEKLSSLDGVSSELRDAGTKGFGPDER
jgi:hypothetical protein